MSPNLWSGVGLVRGGAGTALVGSHEEVADRIAEYHELGIDEFILSGYPHVEEAYWFGEGVMPVLRRRGLLGAPPHAGAGRRPRLTAPAQVGRLRPWRRACGRMCHAGGVDEVTWGALTLTLTAIGAVWTWFAFRRRGVASGLRGAAFTLLPPAAFLTGTLEMFTEIGGSVADWATHLVLSPVVWLGIVLAGVSGVLFVVSGALRARQGGDAEPRGRRLVGSEPSRRVS